MQQTLSHTSTGSGSLGAGSSSMRDGSLLRTEPTASPTGSARSPTPGVRSRPAASSAPTWGDSHASHVSGGSTSGTRSWMAARVPDAAVVTTVVDTTQRAGSSSGRDGSRQNSYSPASAL